MARLLCPRDFPGKNTGVGCHAPLQGIFLTQESNPWLLHLLHWHAKMELVNKWLAFQSRKCKRCGFGPWIGKIPCRRAWLPIPVFLPEEFHDRGAWRATVHGVTESQTRLKCLKTQGDLMKLHAHRRSGKPTPGKEGNDLQPQPS